MLVNRTPARVIHKPRRNARPVEAAQALQARHSHADRKFFQANRALGIVDAVLFCRRICVHAAPSRWDWQSSFRHDAPGATICAVRLYAARNMRFSQGFIVKKRPLR